MRSIAIGAIAAATLCVVPFLSLADDSAPAEEWSLQRIHGTPISAELPSGGTVLSRDLNSSYPGNPLKGRQITLQEWPDALWSDSLRLDYYDLGAVKRTESAPAADEWAYGLSDHMGPDTLPHSSWSSPEVKKRGGYRVYEETREYTVKGEALASAEYRVELGPKKMFLLALYCRKSSFKRYAPYYVRLRDSLVLPKSSGNR